MHLLKSCLSLLANCHRNITKGLHVYLVVSWLLCTMIPLAQTWPVKRGASSWNAVVTSPILSKRRSPEPYYDWCQQKVSGDMLAKSRQALMESLEQDGYDWPALYSGMTKLISLSAEVSNFGSKVLEKLHDIFNQNENLTEALASMYLEKAQKTPLAEPLIEEDSLDKPINAPAMARRIEEVFLEHAQALSAMLIRLHVLHENENQENLKELLSGFIGETQQVLCFMQEVFHHVTPLYSLPAPLEESDIDDYEINTLGEVSHMALMRRFAAYGVVMRHMSNLRVMGGDMDLLREQIQEHTSP